MKEDAILVFGPPGSRCELVAAELSALGQPAIPWDGTRPLVGEGDGNWPRMLRTVASADICHLRAGADAPQSWWTSWTVAVDRQRAARLRTHLVLDTSRTADGQLAARVRSVDWERVLTHGRVVIVEAFSFARGVPLDLDCCLDVRPLRNPYWEPHLRELPGTDPGVREFVLKQPMAESLIAVGEGLVRAQLDGAERPWLRLAVGCTGGFHRSVAVADELARRLRARGSDIQVWHRELWPPD